MAQVGKKDKLLRSAYYSLHQAQSVIARSAATKQSPSEIATPFGLAMTTFCSSECKQFHAPSNKIDDLVKSPNFRFFVISPNPGSGPGKAPESCPFKYLQLSWTPVSTGVTTFYENIKISISISGNG